jgi:hypothetical protein
MLHDCHSGLERIHVIVRDLRSVSRRAGGARSEIDLRWLVESCSRLTPTFPSRAGLARKMYQCAWNCLRIGFWLRSARSALVFVAFRAILHNGRPVQLWGEAAS